MLIISQRQLDLLADVRMRDAKDLLLARGQRLFPVDTALMGTDALAEMAEHALRRARKHGLEMTFDVFSYFDLMFALGSHFDVDPFLPWAATALSLPAEGGERLQVLRDDAMAWLEAATGEDGTPAVKAMVRARALSMDDIAQLRIGTAFTFSAPLPDPDLVAPDDVDRRQPAPTVSETMERLRTFLADVHPEKARAIGIETIDHGMREALHRAELVNLTSPLGQHLYVLLSFMLGSGFARDPLFPWAARALHDVSERDRAELLYDAARQAAIDGLESMRTMTAA